MKDPHQISTAILAFLIVGFALFLGPCHNIVSTNRHTQCYDTVAKELSGKVWKTHTPQTSWGYPHLICPVTIYNGKETKSLIFEVLNYNID